MLKYAQLINEETKQCNVGLGDDEAFYKSMGFELMDVEEDQTDGSWYLAGHVPFHTKTKEEVEFERRRAYVFETDPLMAGRSRKMFLGTWTDEDVAALKIEIERISEEIKAKYPYPDE